MAITVEIELDAAVVEGVRVPRPSRVPRDEWKKFWERARKRRDGEKPSGVWDA